MLLIGMFRLQQIETKRSVFLKEFIFGFASIFYLATIIALTVICLHRSATVTSTVLPPSVLTQLLQASGQSLAYRDTIAFATMIVAWLCFGSTLLSLFLVSLATRHIARFGPEPAPLAHGIVDESGHLVHQSREKESSPNSEIA